MSGSLNALKTAPLPFKATIGMVMAGGLVGLAYALGGNAAMYVVVIALAVVSVVVALYVLLLKKLNKGKSKPFMSKLSENSAATPSGVSDVSARARLDDLRRTFEQGIQTFKEHGKDLYSMPWYVLVGEPGSGKTEAIRHSSVGFPPGLQDQLQGAGGTLNMNWWFTNHAVIIDTAGRLMFEDVTPGQSNEWKEFLKLLRQARPNCPINGMMLVIPADALIKDTQNEIEAKAGKIARQLDDIQRSLGVRFPVFIVISKADLINGFREFFDDMTDPVLASQMIGWSNPSDLDEPFKPELVEEHLADVRERLLRRRLGLLVDPVHTEDQVGGRRMDQVDALYAFPDSLTKIGPRLRRYLEMIFVQGEWSQKPLFLRGIYFTSSMRDGEALDQELAEALGMQVENLPEGRGWTKDRSYFLKDLFIDKVFRERGLVTRAGNTRQLKRRRRLVLMAAAFVLIAGLGALTWFGSRELDRSMAGPSAFWTAIDKVHAEEIHPASDDRENWSSRIVYVEPTGEGRWPLVQYNEYESSVSGTEVKGTVAELNALTAGAVGEAPSPPMIFGPIALAFSGSTEGPFGKVSEAQRLFFDDTVLLPAVDLTRRRLEDRGDVAWSPAATDAAAELLRLEVGAAGHELERGFDPMPLLVYLLGYGGNEAAGTFGQVDATGTPAAHVAAAYRAAYGESGKPWESPVVQAGSARARSALEAGVGAFVGKWADATTDETTELGKLSLLRAAVRSFEEAESKLVRLSTSLGQADSVEGFQRIAATGDENWAGVYAELGAAKQRVDDRLELVAAYVDLPWDRLRPRLMQDATAAASAQYDALIDAIPGEITLDEERPESADSWLARQRAALVKGRDELEESVSEDIAQFEEVLSRIRSEFISKPGGSDRAYQIRYAMYGVAIDRLNAAVPAAELFTAAEAFASVSSATERAVTSIENKLELSAAAGDSMAKARDAAVTVVKAVERRQNTGVALAVIEGIGSGTFDDLVSSRVEVARLDPMVAPVIPMTRLRGSAAFDRRYRPDAAEALFSALGGIRAAVSGGASSIATGGVLDVSTLERGLDDARAAELAYVRAYLGYWANDVPLMATLETGATWSALQSELDGLPSAADINDRLARLSETIVEAVSAVPADVIAGDARVSARLEATRGDIGRLAAPAFREKSAELLRSWRGLAVDASDAKTVVMGMDLERFRDQMLAAAIGEAESEGLGTSYWRDLNLELFRALADDAFRDAQAARTRLVQDACVFPLCLDATEMGSWNDVQQAARRIRMMRPPAAAQSTVAGASSLRAGATLNEYLKKLQGQTATLPGDDEWLSGLSRIIDELESGGIEWQPIVLSDGLGQAHVSGDADLLGEVLSIEMYVGQARQQVGALGEQFGIDDTMATGRWFKVAPNNTGDGLRFRFARALEAAPADFQFETRLPSGFADWGGLLALRGPSGPARPLPGPDDATGAYVLRLDTSFNNRPYYLGVKFRGDVEGLLGSWPRIRSGAGSPAWPTR